MLIITVEDIVTYRKLMRSDVFNTHSYCSSKQDFKIVVQKKVTHSKSNFYTDYITVTNIHPNSEARERFYTTDAPLSLLSQF